MYNDAGSYYTSEPGSDARNEDVFAERGDEKEV
jgi:hypothetical protein